MIRNAAQGLAMVCAVVGAAAATAAPALDCDTRLDRTLAAMQDRPLLKEEHATALMWLRMDAGEAAAAGDEAGCVAKVAVAETLLGIGVDAP